MYKKVSPYVQCLLLLAGTAGASIALARDLKEGLISSGSHPARSSGMQESSRPLSEEQLRLLEPLEDLLPFESKLFAERIHWNVSPAQT